MSLFIQTILLGAIALIIAIFSPLIASWFLWGGYLFFSIGLFFTAQNYRRRWRAGESLKTGTILGAASLPYTTIIILVVLIVFLFIDLSKFHLLWIVNAITFGFETIFAKRINKELEKKFIKVDNQKK